MDGKAKTLIDGAITGAKAGFAASVPTGAAMHVGRLATAIPSRVPFSAVTRALETKAGIGLDEDAHQRLAWAAHLGYGAAFGALFGATTALLPQQARTTAVTTGLGGLFGLAVWALSYAGWLPKARVLPAAKDSSTRFNVVNIGSHIVWGTSMGAMVGRGAQERLNDEKTIAGELASRSG
jgi:hypothetical protein